MQMTTTALNINKTVLASGNIPYLKHGTGNHVAHSRST